MVNITTAGIPACARHFPALAQLPCQKRRMALFTLLITAPGLRQSLLPGHGSGWFPQALDLSAVSLPLYLFLSPQSAASQLRNSATPPPGVAELRSWPSLKSPERESIHEKKTDTFRCRRDCGNEASADIPASRFWFSYYYSTHFGLNICPPLSTLWVEPKGDGALGLARGPYGSFYPGTLPEKQGPASQLRNSATPPPGVAELEGVGKLPTQTA